MTSYSCSFVCFANGHEIPDVLSSSFVDNTDYEVKYSMRHPFVSICRFPRTLPFNRRSFFVAPSRSSERTPKALLLFSGSALEGFAVYSVLKRSECFSLDVDECEIDLAQCGGNAYCTNTIGSFLCTCKLGFAGSDNECIGEYIQHMRSHSSTLLFKLLRLLLLFLVVNYIYGGY